jgi:hypothetical protein
MIENELKTNHDFVENGIAGVCFWLLVIVGGALFLTHALWYDRITDKLTFWITFAETIATLCLAAGTFWLASRTAQMARDGKLAREQADLHHRQQLSCLVAVDTCVLKQKSSEEGPLRELVTAMELTNPVRNLGGGPALNNSIVLHLPKNPEPFKHDIAAIPNLGSNSVSAAQVQFFSRVPDALNAESWDWTDAVVIFHSHNIFNDIIIISYRFAGVIAAPEQLDAPEHLQEGVSVLFMAQRFDISKFGHRTS